MKNIAANIGPSKVQTDLIPLICTLIPEEEDEVRAPLTRMRNNNWSRPHAPNPYLLHSPRPRRS